MVAKILDNRGCGTTTAKCDAAEGKIFQINTYAGYLFNRRTILLVVTSMEKIMKFRTYGTQCVRDTAFTIVKLQCTNAGTFENHAGTMLEPCAKRMSSGACGNHAGTCGNDVPTWFPHVLTRSV